MNLLDFLFSSQNSTPSSSPKKTDNGSPFGLTMGLAAYDYADIPNDYFLRDGLKRFCFMQIHNVPKEHKLFPSYYGRFVNAYSESEFGLSKLIAKSKTLFEDETSSCHEYFDLLSRMESKYGECSLIDRRYDHVPLDKYEDELKEEGYTNTLNRNDQVSQVLKEMQESLQEWRDYKTKWVTSDVTKFDIPWKDFEYHTDHLCYTALWKNLPHDLYSIELNFYGNTFFNIKNRFCGFFTLEYTFRNDEQAVNYYHSTDRDNSQDDFL